jgi:hypothetical protein
LRGVGVVKRKVKCGMIDVRTDKFNNNPVPAGLLFPDFAEVNCCFAIFVKLKTKLKVGAFFFHNIF